NSRRVAPSDRVAAGDRIRIPPVRVAEREERTPAPRLNLAVLFEDEALLAIDKPAGLAVHGGSGVAHGVIESLRAMRPEARFLEPELLTGRTHQLRVHLAHLGHPVLGDEKYGDFALNRELRKLGLKRMFLHAARLAFAHPLSGAAIEIAASLPPELASFAAA